MERIRAAAATAALASLCTVSAWAATSGAPVIMTPSAGAHLRGIVSVEAGPPVGVEADDAVAALAVDGSVVATSALPWRFRLDTKRYAPGPHVLGVRGSYPHVAIAVVPDAAETTRAVVVDNAPPKLVPVAATVRVASPPAKGAVLAWRVSDVVTTPVCCDVRISDGKSVVRRARFVTWAMRRARTTRWRWDGRDARGAYVPRGRYVVSVVVTDTAGNRRLYTGSTGSVAVVVGRYVVVIDPGHQGRADLRPEAIGPGSRITKPRVAGGGTGVVSRMPESRVTLAVALRLERMLAAKGYAVVLCRRSQVASISNKERAELANRRGADLFVRIHLDSMPNRPPSGTSMQYPAVNRWTKPIAARSRKAAGIVHEALVRELGLPDRGMVARGDMTGFNWSKVPVVLPELAFLSHPRDDRLLTSPIGQAKAARGLARGIEGYLAGVR